MQAKGKNEEKIGRAKAKIEETREQLRDAGGQTSRKVYFALLDEHSKEDRVMMNRR